MNLDRGRFAIGSLALTILALAVLPSLASARFAYFTGADEEASGYAAPVNLATQTAGGHIVIGGEGAPRDVAITPNGSTAYVPGNFHELLPIAVASDTEGAPILLGNEPWTLAIAPDGKRIYSANRFENSVSAIDLMSGTEVGAPIPVGNSPNAIAITPDGSRAYVVNEGDDDVSVIDLATDTVIATIPVGSAPSGVSVTPDGASVYVINRIGETVSQIDVATNTVVTTIPNAPGEDLVIAPNGAHAYALGASSGITPIDLAGGTASAAIPITGFSQDLAILPDGSRAYITVEDPDGMVPLDLAGNTLGTSFEVGSRPGAIAIVPNQPPHAAFAATVQGSGVATASSTEAGNGAVAFNASASTDPDGTVARYDWEFGDGATLANGGATPQHTYAKPGTYTVTLTTTDNEGCSTRLVFTGQTAYCNGSGVARVAHQVTIGAPPACTVVKSDASTFIPKRRPGRVSPGVRVKLSANAPAHLVAKAKLLWSLGGKSGSADLGKATVNIKQSGRVRFVIPSSLRGELPLGTPVAVKLRIEATPRGSSGCKATVANRTVHVHVVKVFPNRVQLLRAR